MKSRGLLSVLAFSEKRENLFFLLLNEPKTAAEIKSYFNVSSPEIIPRIKEMETKNLICKVNKHYVLTPSRKVKAISPIVHPMYPGFFLHLAEKGIDISISLTRNAINKIRKENSDLLARILSFENVNLYVSDEEIKLTCIVTDIFFGICLFNKNGAFDSRTELISYDKSALLWGEELFDYFKDRSQKIENL